MKIISSDPNNFIPPIMEKDIDNTVMVLYLKSRYDDKNYVGYMFRSRNGININGGINHGNGKSVEWYSNQPDVISSISRMWKCNSSSFDITLYILESHQDVTDLFKIATIWNVEVLALINSEVNLKFGSDKNE